MRSSSSDGRRGPRGSGGPALASRRPDASDDAAPAPPDGRAAAATSTPPCCSIDACDLRVDPGEIRAEVDQRCRGRPAGGQRRAGRWPPPLRSADRAARRASRAPPRRDVRTAATSAGLATSRRPCDMSVASRRAAGPQRVRDRAPGWPRSAVAPRSTAVASGSTRGRRGPAHARLERGDRSWMARASRAALDHLRRQLGDRASELGDAELGQRASTCAASVRLDPGDRLRRVAPPTRSSTASIVRRGSLQALVDRRAQRVHRAGHRVGRRRHLPGPAPARRAVCWSASSERSARWCSVARASACPSQALLHVVERRRSAPPAARPGSRPAAPGRRASAPARPMACEVDARCSCRRRPVGIGEVGEPLLPRLGLLRDAQLSPPDHRARSRRASCSARWPSASRSVRSGASAASVAAVGSGTSADLSRRRVGGVGQRSQDLVGAVGRRAGPRSVRPARR